MEGTLLLIETKPYQELLTHYLKTESYFQINLNRRLNYTQQQCGQSGDIAKTTVLQSVWEMGYEERERNKDIYMET